ncbi:hypothetical protein [Nocardia sp. NPDC059239]|uniref:DUF7373 family lipoprotein n=1 Tax=unclassified Nocardia TaxID=2637762 RepID=UPI0036893188
MGAAVLVLATACGTDGGAPDYGPYAIHGDDDFDRQPSRIRGIFAESVRLADHIVFATDIDPDLTTVRGGGISADDRGFHETALSPQQRAAARPFGVAGSFGIAVAFGVRAFSALSPEPPHTLGKYSGSGVTALAVSHNKYLYRMRDSKAAAQYGRDLAADPENSEYTWMRNVRGLTAATCSQATRPDPKSVQARRYRCVVARDGYVAVVYSSTETDVRQLAAAQYAIMGGPR